MSQKEKCNTQECPFYGWYAAHGCRFSCQQAGLNEFDNVCYAIEDLHCNNPELVDFYSIMQQSSKLRTHFKSIY